MRGTWKVVLFGALLGLLVVAVAVGLVATGKLPTLTRTPASVDGPVLVALVLPDAHGVVVPRVIDVYSRNAGAWSLKSVDPTMPALVQGTSGSTLADAYSFGGGEELAAAYSRETGAHVSAWIIVDAQGLGQLLGARGVSVDLPADIAAFDGQQLYSYSAGATETPVAQLPQLMDGVAFLSAADQRTVRQQVGDDLASALATGGPTGVSDAVRSNLSSTQLGEWAASLGKPARLPAN